MKEKGTSWAYATPGFGASLSASNLAQLRQLTGTLASHQRFYSQHKSVQRACLTEVLLDIMQLQIDCLILACLLAQYLCPLHDAHQSV